MLEPLNLLRQAVSIPSVSGQEQEVAEYLVSEMSTFAEAFVDEAGNAVAKLGKGKRHVIFLGHIDTVPGEIPLRLEDGNLYGRGAVDAKGPFCAAIIAASQLGPEVLDGLRITLIGAVEEEAPSSKGARHAVRAYEQPDAVIIGEPSGWDAVTLGYKGRLVVKLKHEKDNFHSAGDDSTAAEDMVGLWRRLEDWAEGFNRDKKGAFERAQLSLQEIGSANDGLTQRAEATIGLRLPPLLSPEEAKEALAPLLVGTEHAFAGEESAYRGDKDTALSRAFRLAIRDLGGQPRVKVKTGTSDMNVVAPAWRVPMLAYGPGDARLDHRPDEHLAIRDYLRAIEVLERVFVRLAA